MSLSIKPDWANFDKSEWTDYSGSEITNMPDGTVKIIIQSTYISCIDTCTKQAFVKQNRHDLRSSKHSKKKNNINKK